MTERPSRSNPEEELTFQDLRIKKLLHSGKFNVFLVSSKKTGKLYALKSFNYTLDGCPSPHYLNESQFKFLNHQNIVQIVYTRDEQKILVRG